MGRDYIDVLCGADPKMAPCELVKIFKGITSREIFSRNPWVKRDVWEGEVLDRWVLCNDSSRMWKLRDSGGVHTGSRKN